MAVLNIHFERANNEKYLDLIIEKNLPVALSIAPYTLVNGWYRESTIEKLKAVLSREGNILGQQGNMHRCKFGHNFVDPWHENYCPWRGKLNAEEQKEFMEKGKGRLEKVLEISPQLYVPPNHLFDKGIIEPAQEIGYRFLAENAILPINPFYLSTFVVVPETKLGLRNAGIVYVHYDEIDKLKKQFEELIARGLEPFDSIKAGKPNHALLFANTSLKLGYKYAGDIKNFPGRLVHWFGEK